ncbi:MAG: hypothetical protein QW733_01895 [Desulfurococcaceae archaeon]
MAMEDKPLRRKIKTFVATRTHIPATYTYISDTIPDTIPDTYIPEKKAKKKRSRFLKLLKRVFGFLWGVFLKVVEIAFLIVVLFVWGLLEGIARGSDADEREWERRKKEEEEKRKREEAWRWWMEESERQKQYYEKSWGQMQYWNYEHRKREEGRESDPNPYASYLY